MPCVLHLDADTPHCDWGSGLYLLSPARPPFSNRTEQKDRAAMSNTWIKSHQSLRTHPKTRKLARRLDVRVPEAIGTLHCLWWWAVDYAEDGDLSKFDHDDIADACEWVGDADALIAAVSYTHLRA